MTPKQLFLLLLASALFATNSQAQESFREIGVPTGLGVSFSQGVSIVDYNGDGLDDIFITRKNRNNQLFKNDGDGTFAEVAATAGLDVVGPSNQTIWADYDNDGDLDCYLTMDGVPNKLYQNQGNGTFTDMADAAGVAVVSNSTAAIWGDVNGDDYLDLFVFQLMEDDRYFLNNGDGTFTDYTSESGIAMERLSMGATFIDFDKDSDLDVYITHDGGAGNFLYENDGKGFFTDVANSTGIYTESEAMGLSVGDFNNDQWPDLYLTNRLENFLFRNNGDGSFSEIAHDAGVDDQGMGWGVSWLDYDNDGWLDLYIANDSYYSDHPNVLYHNNGDETFSRVDADKAISSEKASYSTAIADLDRDGYADLIMANRGNIDRSELFLNEVENGNNWLVLGLACEEATMPVIGSSLTVVTSEATHSRYVLSGTSWSADDSKRMMIGLGSASTIETVTVTWPDGTSTAYTGLEINSSYLLGSDGASTQVNYVETPLQLSEDPGGGEIVTSTEDDSEIAPDIQVFPNPFTNQLNVHFELTAFSQVTLSLQPVNGKIADPFYAENLPVGAHSIQLPIGPLTAGLYLLQIQIGESIIHRKVIRNN